MAQKQVSRPSSNVMGTRIRTYVPLRVLPAIFRSRVIEGENSHKRAIEPITIPTRVYARAAIVRYEPTSETIQPAVSLSSFQERSLLLRENEQHKE